MCLRLPESRLDRLVLAQIAQMIEAVRLQVGLPAFDGGEGGFGQDFLGDVLHGGIGDLVDEADVIWAIMC